MPGVFLHVAGVLVRWESMILGLKALERRALGRVFLGKKVSLSSPKTGQRGK
jgi:hypothetical protein